MWKIESTVINRCFQLIASLWLNVREKSFFLFFRNRIVLIRNNDSREKFPRGCVVPTANSIGKFLYRYLWLNPLFRDDSTKLCAQINCRVIYDFERNYGHMNCTLERYRCAIMCSSYTVMSGHASIFSINVSSTF